MGKTWSLKKQLFILMSLLVALQSISLVFALIGSKVFFALDAEAFRVFENTIDTRAKSFNKSIGDLAVNTANEALKFKQSVATMDYGEYFDTIGDNQNIVKIINEKMAESVFNLLQNNNITGAYIVIDGNFGDRDERIKSSIYIRDNTPRLEIGGNSRYSMEIGPSFIAQKYGIPLSVNWDISLDFTDGLKKDFYYKPLEAIKTYPNSELLRYGYWTEPTNLLDNGNKGITYSLPLLDKNGHGLGVIGIEVSLPYFTQYYLPNTDIPYTTSFYAIGRSEDNIVDFDWYIPSGPLAELHLDGVGQMPIKKLSNTNLWVTQLEDLSDMYCSIHNLKLYSDNSPFNDDTWTLVGFVSMTSLHKTSYEVRKILIGSIIGTTLIAVMVVFILSYYSTRKIEGLSDYIRKVEYYQEVQFTPTGLQEIDQLTSAIERLNRDVRASAKVTSKVMELTDMSIGYFEVVDNRPYVTITGYIYDLLDINQGTLINCEQWKVYYTLITDKPNEELGDVYYYNKKNTVEGRWLRIKESETENGRVGIVMDVTKDIETNLRLAKELDYDKLTGLATRDAFKREVYELIKKQPNKIGAMIFADLDNLKYMNDSYGHDFGDKYLIKAGEVFGQFRECGGIVSRISGDEFAVYLHGYDNKEELKEIMWKQLEEGNKIRITLLEGEEEKVRYSGGIAWYPQDGDNVIELLKYSDYAMYQAKNNKKGTVRYFSK